MNKHDHEFKDNAAVTALNGDRSLTEMTLDFGVNNKTSCIWVGQAMLSRNQILNKQSLQSKVINS